VNLLEKEKGERGEIKGAIYSIFIRAVRIANFRWREVGERRGKPRVRDKVGRKGRGRRKGKG